MINPQKENGFTAIANELMEIIAKTDFNGTQRRIIDVVLRQTYGWQRKEHELSLTFIATATGIHKMQVQRELATLIERNVILITKEGSYTKPRTLAFNKKYNSWVISEQLTKKLTGSELDNETGSELANSTVSELANQRKKVKEIKENSDYDNFVKELLQFYPGKKVKLVRDKKLPPIIKKYGENKVMDCVKNYAKSVINTDKQYILNESTFWNTRYIDFMEDEKDIEPIRPPIKKVYRENI